MNNPFTYVKNEKDLRGNLGMDFIRTWLLYLKYVPPRQSKGMSVRIKSYIKHLYIFQT